MLETNELWKQIVCNKMRLPQEHITSPKTASEYLKFKPCKHWREVYQQIEQSQQKGMEEAKKKLLAMKNKDDARKKQNEIRELKSAPKQGKNATNSSGFQMVSESLAKKRNTSTHDGHSVPSSHRVTTTTQPKYQSLDDLVPNYTRVPKKKEVQKMTLPKNVNLMEDDEEEAEQKPQVVIRLQPQMSLQIERKIDFTQNRPPTPERSSEVLSPSTPMNLDAFLNPNKTKALKKATSDASSRKAKKDFTPSMRVPNEFKSEYGVKRPASGDTKNQPPTKKPKVSVPAIDVSAVKSLPSIPKKKKT